MDSTVPQYPALRRAAPSGRTSSQSTSSGAGFLASNIESPASRLPTPSDHVSSQFTCSGSTFLTPNIESPAFRILAPSDHVSLQFTSSGSTFLTPNIQSPTSRLPAASDHVFSQFASSGPASLTQSVQPPAPRTTNNSNLQQPVTPRHVRSRLVSSRSARSRPAHARLPLQRLAPRPQYFLPPSALARQALQSTAPRSQPFLPSSTLSQPVLHSVAPPPQHFLPPSAVSQPVLQPSAPSQSFLPPSGLSQPPRQSLALSAPPRLYSSHLPPAHWIQGHVPQATLSTASRRELELLMGLNFYISPDDGIWDPKTGRGAYLDLTEDDMTDDQLSSLWNLELPSETTSSAQPYLLDQETSPSALKLPSLRQLNLLNLAQIRPDDPDCPGNVLPPPTSTDHRTRPEFFHSHLHPRSGVRVFEPPVLAYRTDIIRKKPLMPDFLGTYNMERVVIIKRVAFGESFETILAFLNTVGYEGPTITVRQLYERMKNYMKKRGFTKVMMMKVLHIENFIRLKTKPTRPRDFGS